jgi:hypothetical protein
MFSFFLFLLFFSIPFSHLILKGIPPHLTCGTGGKAAEAAQAHAAMDPEEGAGLLCTQRRRRPPPAPAPPVPPPPPCPIGAFSVPPPPTSPTRRGGSTMTHPVELPSSSRPPHGAPPVARRPSPSTAVNFHRVASSLRTAPLRQALALCAPGGRAGKHGHLHHEAARSLILLAPALLWKPRGAPAPAPHPEPVEIRAFGRALAGATRGAAHGALPNRA